MSNGVLPDALHAWRHPRADGAAGRCIGRIDLAVDTRRAKRLAHHIRSFARRRGLPHIVVTSSLERSLAVGRWLARWGWQHRVDPALCELDFGHWDGQPWQAVPHAEIDAWCQDFAQHAPGGGEPVAALLQRVQGFDPGTARLLVTHGGWLSAALWLQRAASAAPCSALWPAAPSHSTRTGLLRPPPLNAPSTR